MKVLALGGTGHVGRQAIRLILKSGEVDHLVVAGRDFNTANHFAKSLRDERVSARGIGIDVEDVKALEEAMSEADIVMNTVGPYYRFGTSVIHAAIKTGCHYVDILDDYGPAQEALALDEKARQAGVTVLIGMGATPGLTNILARHATNQLDKVDYIQTVWGFTGGVRPSRSALLEGEFTVPFVRYHAGAASTIHMFYCLGRKAPIFRDGKLVEVVPLEDGEEVTFPNGKGLFWYFGHGCEVVTLPHFIKGLKGACNLFGLDPEALHVYRRLGEGVRAKEISLEQAVAMYPRELDTIRKQQRPNKVVDMGPLVGGFHASASGIKGGKRVKYGYGFRGKAPKALGTTAPPFAIGAEMIMNGEISQRGVLAPEACIDPPPFFERYMKCWENPPESVEQAVYKVVEEL